MARTKPTQLAPLEENPHFLTLVEELVNVGTDQFPAIAIQCVEKYHDAVLAGHVDVLEKLERAYKALVYKLNGGTMFASSAEEGSAANVLARAVSAKPGQVPCWGQAGEFLLEVEGVRVRVAAKSHMLGSYLSLDLHAVDLDRPYISSTGYRSEVLTVVSNIGKTVDQAVRRLVLDLMQSNGRLKPIDADARVRANLEKAPGWLVDALAGVRSDGQMAMFGDAPKDPGAKVPLTNAERQKAFRDRKRAEKEAAKGEGHVSLLLARDDLAFLWWAVDVFLTARSDLEHLKSPYVQELLAKVFSGCSWWAPDALEKMGRDEGFLNGESRREAERKRGWDAYKDERKRTDKLAMELAQTRADNKRMQDTLKEIAAELGGAVPAPINAGQLEALTLQVAALQKEERLLIDERTKAFAAAKVFEDRLRSAGLSTDCRRQPGE